jgi:Fe2+ transport system protein B
LELNANDNTIKNTEMIIKLNNSLINLENETTQKIENIAETFKAQIEDIKLKNIEYNKEIEYIKSTSIRQVSELISNYIKTNDRSQNEKYNKEQKILMMIAEELSHSVKTTKKIHDRLFKVYIYLFIFRCMIVLLMISK